jgi:putative membrane protein
VKIFLTRHPLPSDDIEAEIGENINKIANSLGYHDILIIDSHNSIIGDEVLIKKDSIEGKDLIKVSENFLISSKKKVNSISSEIKYGVAKDALSEYSERDGIGSGGIVVHLFKNLSTDQKTVLVHFDANNAYVDIRSFILNMLQNRGIVLGEVTTSDSHTVARQFTSRGYSPIGEKIKLEYILTKLEELIAKAEKNLTEVEFSYYSSEIENVKIWGDPKYFDAIMNTLQECIRVSQKLLTYSLILPTFFSLLILLFYYNITFGNI